MDSLTLNLRFIGVAHLAIIAGLAILSAPWRRLAKRSPPSKGTSGSD
jgi:hypothetical protein